MLSRKKKRGRPIKRSTPEEQRLHAERMCKMELHTWLPTDDYNKVKCSRCNTQEQFTRLSPHDQENIERIRKYQLINPVKLFNKDGY